MIDSHADIIELPAGTFITHGENPQAFTLKPGIYIAKFYGPNKIEDDFRVELKRLLFKWFKNNYLNIDYINARSSAKQRAVEDLDRHIGYTDETHISDPSHRARQKLLRKFRMRLNRS